MNVRWGRPQQSSFNNDDGPKCTPVPGLPNALPNPGQVVQHDPAKRAKFSQEVKKPMGNPIDLPSLKNMAPRAPSEFLPPDSGNASANAPVRFVFHFLKQTYFVFRFIILHNHVIEWVLENMLIWLPQVNTM